MLQSHLQQRRTSVANSHVGSIGVPSALRPAPFKSETRHQNKRTRSNTRLQVHALADQNQAVHQLAAIPALQSSAIVPSLAAGAALLTGVAAWRFAVYGRLQYITAAMLGRWVPKGNARVIQVGGSSRDLYYYPEDTVLVTAISPKLNKGIMGQAGIQAGVPVEVRQETPTNLAFQANSSVEAVVCLQSLHTIADLPRFLGEVQRVLTPGSPFIFLQPVKGEGLAAVAQLLLGGAGSALEMAQFEQLKQTSGFTAVNWDVALVEQNPHVVGVATKAKQASDDSDNRRPSARSKSRRKQAIRNGFAGS